MPLLNICLFKNYVNLFFIKQTNRAGAQSPLKLWHRAWYENKFYTNETT